MDRTRYEFAWGAFILRVALGLLFFTAGLGKFMKGAAGISHMIAQQFAGTWLPAWLVAPYAMALPYAEITFGFFILIGLFRGVFLTLGGLLMVSLAFGMMVNGKQETMNVLAFN